MTEDIDTAHDYGRHASRHPDDVMFWIDAGCTNCSSRQICVCGAITLGACFCNLSPSDFIASGNGRCI